MNMFMQMDSIFASDNVGNSSSFSLLFLGHLLQMLISVQMDGCMGVMARVLEVYLLKDYRGHNGAV